MVDNDPTPTVSNISNPTIAEGGDLVYTVNLTNPSSTSTSFAYNLGGGTAAATDYGSPTFSNGVTLSGGVLTVPAGVTSFTMTLPTTQDVLDEANETVPLTIGGVTGTGTITDNDPTPSLSINDVTINEAAGTATFTVTLSAASGQTVTVGYSTSDGTAISGSDYSSATGVLTFAPGTTTQTITVPITNDTLYEGATGETFNVTLSGATNALIADGAGVGTITDNDAVPTIASVTSPTVTEGTDLSYTVTLSNGSSTATTFAFSLGGGSATGGDYGTPSFSNGVTLSGSVLTVPAGVTGFTITLPTVQDSLYEGNETVPLTVGGATGTGTIVDNETAPALSVGSTTVSEDAGYAVFTVSLSRPSAVTTTVSLALGNGSATGGAVDFGALDGSNLQVSTDGGLTWSNASSYSFAPGATSVLVRTPIVNDVIYEPVAESFTLTATTTAGTTSNASATGAGTITDNDAQPSISVGDVYVQEGGTMVFTVTLSNPSAQTVSVNYATANGTATAGAAADYTAMSGLLTFAAGVTSMTVSVPTRADGVSEANETLYLNLSSATNATIADNQGLGTIMERIQAVPDAGTVYESALSTGTLASNTGETVTGNLLSNDFSPTTMAVNRVTFNGTNYSASGNVITVDTPLGLLQVYTTSGTYNGVARAAGDYVYTLQTNSTGGDSVSEQFSYRITNGSTSSTANLNVRIVDDAPVGSDVTHTLQAADGTTTYNLVLVIDVSGSMAQDANGNWSYEADFDPTTVRMEIAKDALASLIQRFDNLGNVNVQIVSFSTGATESSWFNDNVDAAIDYINGLQPGGGTQYSTALNAVMTGFTQPEADRTVFYFVSDGEPNSGFEVNATQQTQWETFVGNQGTATEPSIAFGIGIGGASLTALQPVAYPNTDANGDGAEDYAIKVSNPTDLAATLLATVDGGVVLGNVSVLSGSGASGLLMGADGGHVQSIVVDGVTYSYVAGGEQTVTIDTLKGGQLTLNYVTGSYEYHLTVNDTIQGQQEVIQVVGVDNDGDTKSINLVINLDYVASLDANRDVILTNVAAGSPITVSAEALMHNDSTQDAATVTATQSAAGGSVAGTGTVTFTPTTSGVPATAISVTREGTSDAYNYTVNDVHQNAVDFTDRNLFGTVLPGGQAWAVDQSGYSRVFQGTISDSSSVNDVDYVKVHLYAGERIFVDVDNQTSAMTAQVEYQDANGAWQTASVANDASGSANGWFNAGVDGDYYVRVGTTGYANTSYNLVLTIDQVHGPIGNQSGQFDYTITENGESSSATVSVQHVSGSVISGGDADEILIGGSSDDTLKGFGGNDALYGHGGADNLQGGEGHDLLDGGQGADILHGGAGIDHLIGGSGNDVLTGGLSADVFAWKFGDQGSHGAPAVDTVTDFDATTGSDALDLRDLLQGEIANPAMQNLENYLHFEKSGSDTILHISANGGFSSDGHQINSAYSSGSEDQRIVLQGVDLVGSNTTDQQVIQDLLNKGKLVTD